jgi:hypothetical protein
MKLLFLAAALSLNWCREASAAMYSVKLVKTEARRCTSVPKLEFVGDGNGWRVTAKLWHNGENDWEIFFELETDAEKPTLPEVRITAPGVKVARAITGKTDVPFTQQGDEATFRLASDQSVGQMMRVGYSSPRGGLPISLDHNWEMRRNGEYLSVPWPSQQVAAVPNYLLAAQEVFRVMGDMGPGPPKKFAGDIVLMSAEVAASRGHADFPQHVHIMHYQFETNAIGERIYVSRLVPHFYMDDDGRIVRNNFAVLAGHGKSAVLGLNDVCRFEDTFGHHVLDLAITKVGLELRRPDGRVYSLRPDPDLGASHAVWGYQGDNPLCRVEAHDDPAHGVFSYQLDTIQGGKVVETLRDGYHYDPFTAKVLGKLP